MEHVMPAEWTTESTYWRDNYRSRPYFSGDRDFTYYEPAYRYGYESATRYRGKSWDEAQRDSNVSGITISFAGTGMA